MKEKINWWWWFLIAAFILPLLNYAFTKNPELAIPIPVLSRYIVMGLNPFLSVPAYIFFLLVIVIIFKAYAGFSKSDIVYRLLCVFTVLIFCCFYFYDFLLMKEVLNNGLPRRYYDLNSNQSETDFNFNSLFTILLTASFFIFFIVNLVRLPKQKTVNDN